MRYNEIAWRPGDILYWASAIIAGLIVLLVVANYIYDFDRGEPSIRSLPLLLAGAIWLAGWAGRHMLAGR